MRVMLLALSACASSVCPSGSLTSALEQPTLLEVASRLDASCPALGSGRLAWLAEVAQRVDGPRARAPEPFTPLALSQRQATCPSGALDEATAGAGQPTLQATFEACALARLPGARWEDFARAPGAETGALALELNAALKELGHEAAGQGLRDRLLSPSTGADARTWGRLRARAELQTLVAATRVPDSPGPACLPLLEVQGERARLEGNDWRELDPAGLRALAADAAWLGLQPFRKGCTTGRIEAVTLLLDPIASGRVLKAALGAVAGEGVGEAHVVLAWDPEPAAAGALVPGVEFQPIGARWIRLVAAPEGTTHPMVGPDLVLEPPVDGPLVVFPTDEIVWRELVRVLERAPTDEAPPQVWVGPPQRKAQAPVVEPTTRRAR